MFGHTHPGRGLSAAVLALLACGEAKPEAPVVPLAPASDSVVAGIGEIGEGAWLGGNRWAVLAPAHDAVAIADLSSHQVRPLGGRGAAEIRNPSTIFRAGDTLARLAPVDVAEVVGDAGRRFERRVFSGSDRWGTWADGSVWVARVNDNRLEWRDSTGAWHRGDALPDRVLEVTRYDRELFLRRFPPELRRTAGELPFAAIKPPFEAALADPGGEIWLEKSRAPTDSGSRYQVLDRQGRLRREIRVPGRGRIVAAGDDAVLVAAPATDGVHLLRFAVPPEAAAR